MKVANNESHQEAHETRPSSVRLPQLTTVGFASWQALHTSSPGVWTEASTFLALSHEVKRSISFLLSSSADSSRCLSTSVSLGVTWDFSSTGGGSSFVPALSCSLKRGAGGRRSASIRAATDRSSSATCSGLGVVNRIIGWSLSARLIGDSHGWNCSWAWEVGAAEAPE